MNKNEILEKIKKCLALGKSTNQHEAAIALRQAKSLMEKYSIDPNDPDLLGIIEIKIKGSGIKKPTTYEGMLANAIAQLMNCKVIGSWLNTPTSTGIRIEGCWKFIGFDPYPEIASYAFDTLYRQLKKARADYIKVKLNRVKIQTNKIKRADMFCMGWVVEATEVARQIKPDLEQMAIIESYVKNTIELVDGSRTNRTGKSVNQRSLNDYLSGRQAGKDARLNHAMHTDQSINIQQLGFKNV